MAFSLSKPSREEERQSAPHALGWDFRTWSVAWFEIQSWPPMVGWGWENDHVRWRREVPSSLPDPACVLPGCGQARS